MGDNFEYTIEQAISAIEDENLELAELFIKKAVVLQLSAPESYNLLGIITEYRGDYLLACKYYRAANALDPTYKPAINNLTRVTRMQTIDTLRQVDLGNEGLQEKNRLKYYIDYDEKNIGHIKKRG